MDVNFLTILFKNSKHLLLNMYEKITMNIRHVEKIRKKEGNSGITRTIKRGRRFFKVLFKNSK